MDWFPLASAMCLGGLVGVLIGAGIVRADSGATLAEAERESYRRGLKDGRADERRNWDGAE